MNIKASYEFLTFEERDGIGFITINRPKKLNALNQGLLNELKELLVEINSDKEYRLQGVIVTGAGDKAFIAGADIAEMENMNPDEARSFSKLGQQVTLLFEKIRIPVIAAVNGFALGGGTEMAMCCDFIYATESAVFGQPEVKLGLIPGFGGTQRLAKLIGRNRAKEMVYTGRNMKAQEALTVGLVVKLFTNKDEMLEAAQKTMKYIQKNSPAAISSSKRAMNEGNDLKVIEGLSVELNEFSEIFKTQDMREGTKAFLEKRAPQFKGC